MRDALRRSRWLGGGQQCDEPGQPEGRCRVRCLSSGRRGDHIREIGWKRRLCTCCIAWYDSTNKPSLGGLANDRRAFILLSAISAIAVPAHAEDNPVVGAWRLVSFDRVIVATKQVVHAFGGHATGFSTYTADGRYISLIVDSTRKPPAQPMATDAEAIALYRTMNAFAGSYRVEGDMIVYHYDISMNQIGIGQEEKRTFKIEGDRLSYTTPPSPSPFLNNQMVSVSAVWERVR